MIAGLVLAAGAGRRFGGQKAIADLDGRPLLEHVMLAAEASGLERVACVLGAEADSVEREVDLHGAEVVRCERWERGQSASLRAGIRALADAEAIAIMLGDQPLLSAAAIDRITAARDTEALAVRATYGGTASHPTLVERALYPRLLALKGNQGARELLERVPCLPVPCDDFAEPLDVDTREDLSRARELLARLRRPRAAASGPASAPGGRRPD